MRYSVLMIVAVGVSFCQVTSPPLLISNQQVQADTKGDVLTFSLVNQSSRDISAWVTYVEIVDEAGKMVGRMGGARIKDSGVALQPDAAHKERFRLPRRADGRAVNFQARVDYVRFADNSSWGPDTQRQSFKIDGYQDGLAAARRRFQRILKSQGKEALIKELERGIEQ